MSTSLSRSSTQISFWNRFSRSRGILLLLGLLLLGLRTGGTLRWIYRMMNTFLFKRVEDGQSHSKKAHKSLGFGKRKKKITITISTQKIILWNPSSDPHEPNFAFREGILDVFKQLPSTASANIIWISKVRSTEEEEQIKTLLSECPALKKLVVPHQVLFCETMDGLIGMIRHIQPHLHIDTDESICEKLRDVIPRVRYLPRSSSVSSLASGSGGDCSIARQNSHTSVRSSTSTSSSPSSESSSMITLTSSSSIPKRLKEILELELN